MTVEDGPVLGISPRARESDAVAAGLDSEPPAVDFDPDSPEAAGEVPTGEVPTGEVPTGDVPTGDVVALPTPRRRRKVAEMGTLTLVTGASGFIGRHLVAALAGRGEAVRAMARSDEAEGRIRRAVADGGADSDAVEVVRADLSDPESLARATADCRLVYHLAGGYRGSPAELSTSHVAGTARVIRAMHPDARLVAVSSTSVYGWDQVWPADHASTPAPDSTYGSAKLAAERLALSRAGGTSVVVRPTITYGMGDRNGMLARCLSLLAARRPFPGDGSNRIHLTHVDDLVEALLRVGDTGTGVYLVGGPTATPLRRILELLADGAGTPPPRFGVPPALLRPVARTLELAWSTVGRAGEAPVSVHSVDVATRDRAYDWGRAAAELAWEPRVDVEQGIPPVAAWLAGELGLAPRNADRRTAAAVASGNASSGDAWELGFDWRSYVTDNDEGLGTVYERFALDDVLSAAVERTGATSILHAPSFGMMGFPGIDAVMLARRGLRVGLVDFAPERLEAVVAQWHELGLDPEVHLVDGADPSGWPDHLDGSYDLAFTFAALWWFDDPWAVLAANARWATKGVVTCVPNQNMFMWMRARLWHTDLFDKLNAEALDRRALVAAGERLGLETVDTGLFDIPPFPDTSVPLAKVLRAALGRGGSDGDAPAEGAWRWSIVPYLTGEQPDLETKVRKMGLLERHLPQSVAPVWAHHRYTVMVPGDGSHRVRS